MNELYCSPGGYRGVHTLLGRELWARYASARACFARAARREAPSEGTPGTQCTGPSARSAAHAAAGRLGCSTTTWRKGNMVRL